MQTILIVDAKSVIRTGGKFVLGRHSKYREALITQSTCSYELRIVDQFGIYTPTHSFNLDNSATEHKGNLFHFIYSLVKLSKSDKSIRLLVAGDPWLSAIAALIVKSLSKTSPSIQIQVHGDIGNKRWKFKSLRNFLKYLVALITLRHAVSIRCVGLTQSKNLSNAFRIDQSRISIIPVQLSLSMQTIYSKKFDAKDLVIGFVGRIHKERSCEKLLTILSVLTAEGYAFTLKVIGDGPGLGKFAKFLATNLPTIRVVYSGWIEEDVLAEEFKKMDILISTADFEAYGRSIREAEVLGISVLATNSSGVVDAARESKTGLIHVLETLKDEEAVLNEFKRILTSRQQTQKDNFRVAEFVPGIRQDIPMELARLWISLGQKQ